MACTDLFDSIALMYSTSWMACTDWTSEIAQMDHTDLTLNILNSTAQIAQKE